MVHEVELELELNAVARTHALVDANLLALLVAQMHSYSALSLNSKHVDKLSA